MNLKKFGKSLLAVGCGLLLASGCQANDHFPLEGERVAGAKATRTEAGLQVDFGNREAWPHIAWRAGTPEGWNWSQYEALVLTIENPGADDVRFHVKVTDHTESGKKHATQVSGNASAGQTERFFISLQSRLLRDKSGMRFLPPIRGDYGTSLGFGVEPGHVDELQIFRAMPKEPATLIIKSVTLEGQAKTLDLNGIIDKYGQYTREDWPGKVKSDADLIAQKKAEESDLRAHPGLPARSKWGGWLDGPRQAATGFFRTTQVEGKWWLVDPDGYLFLSVGIDVIRPDLSTRIAGREEMFTDLDEAYFSQDKRNYNFLTANMDRKYGTDNTESAFGDRAVKRLKSWGFNTIGNWTPERLGRERQFPYVVAVGTKGGFATVAGHRGHRMPDPFDPAFAADVETNLAPKAALARNDPAVVGYFFDNELPWGMPNQDAERYVLAFGALALGPDSPAKNAFVDLLKTRHESLDSLNAAWKTKFASWDEVLMPFKASAPFKSSNQRADFSAFLSHFADKYFEVVSSAIKKHDPNHLYLGCRFAYWFTPEAVKSAAKYSDAISFNIYTWNRNTYAFAQELGKPCIVGEFHFGATDRGMFSGNVTVESQEARGESYANYLQTLLSEPAFVGAHWFQYYDEPTTGRSQDGENFNIGFASITDMPYPELIAAAREANRKIYQWHADAPGATRN